MMRRILLFALLVCSTAHADEANFPTLVTQLESAADARLEAIKSQLISGGMAAHDALKTGAPATETLRAELRRSIRARRDAQTLAGGLVLHEWGILTSNQGAEGSTSAIQPSPFDLPSFVQHWNKLAPSKNDSPVHPGIQIDPVIHFYSKSPQTMTVTIACPRGMLTNWYPNITRVQPPPGTIDLAKDSPSGGMLLWKNFDLLPAAQNLPPVHEQAWWWPLCRQADSTPLKMNEQSEKFLYYGGILDTPLPVELEGGAAQKYTLNNTSKYPIRNVMVVHVTAAHASFQHIPRIEPKSSLKVDASIPKDAKPAWTMPAPAREMLAELLEEAGLFPKEAQALAQVGERQWFERPGVRIIYFNPPESTASLLPIRCDPAPASKTRVLLAVHECLADSLGNVVKKLIAQLGDDSFARREEASARLTELGSKALPDLIGAMKKTDDTEVRNRLQAIVRKIDPKSKAFEELPKPEPDPDFDLER